MQPVGGWQTSLKPAPEKVLEKPEHNRIGSPFSALDRLGRTLGQSRDFLRQPFIPEIPSKTAGEQTGNFGCSAPELALNCYHVNHCVYPQPTATSPPAPGSFFFKKNARTNMMEHSMPKTQKMSIYDSAPASRCTNS